MTHCFDIVCVCFTVSSLHFKLSALASLDLEMIRKGGILDVFPLF